MRSRLLQRLDESERVEAFVDRHMLAVGLALWGGAALAAVALAVGAGWIVTTALWPVVVAVGRDSPALGLAAAVGLLVLIAAIAVLSLKSVAQVLGIHRVVLDDDHSCSCEDDR